MGYLCNSKESNGHLASVQSTLFCLDLLETETVCFLVEVIKTRSCPLLILLCVLFSQTVDVLT